MTSLHAHATSWRVAETARYIVERGYSVVTLQLPDELLAHATQLAGWLQEECKALGHLAVKLYVLADTTYNSLSVDEVAAQHVGAQCVIHYGRASMTKLSRLPAYFVFPEAQLDVAAAAAAIAGSSLVASSQHAVVFLDQPLLHLLPSLQEQLAALLAAQQASVQVVYASVPSQHLEPQQAGAAGASSSSPSPANGGGCCRAGAGVATQPLEQSSAAAAAGCCQPQQPAAAAACCGASQQDCSAVATGTAAAAAPREDADSSQEHTASSNSGSSASSQGESLAGYAWQLPEGVSTADCCLAWVGDEEAPALLQLQMTHNASQWAVLDPQQGGQLQEGLPLQISRGLRRRYFLVEKARLANIVGILVGTLGVAGYRDAIQQVRQAAQRAGKKTYTLLMGKPSPAKLANFPEIEVFVMVADPQGQILDCKEYLSPIITPYEAMLAFSPDSEWDERGYRLDFDGVLEEAGAGDGKVVAASGPRFSFVDGTYHATEADDEQAAAGSEAATGDAASNALALRAQEALQITPAPGGRSDLVQAKSAADYFVHKRTFLGVESPLVGAPEKAVETAAPGRSGRAAGYRDEPPR